MVLPIEEIHEINKEIVCKISKYLYKGNYENAVDNCMQYIMLKYSTSSKIWESSN